MGFAWGRGALWGSQIGDEGAKSLAEALRVNKGKAPLAAEKRVEVKQHSTAQNLVLKRW